ncbi:DnaJ (Hsp40), sub C, member 2 [Allomyces arbusculus]|nr:DnaJ (Hsp40), sub C, member 2 [Allomyces arbusculus]
MAALNMSLAPAPGAIDAGAAATRAVAKLSAFRELPIDRASPRFAERHDPSDESALAALFGAATVDKFPEDDDDEADVIDPRMMFLDPTQWKEQDHYFVLGLQDARFRATDAEIKTAYRRRVLQYHPDKLQASAAPGATDLDATFKCIQKAHEILSDPVKRMQYDSVDPAIDFTIPSDLDIKSWISADGPDAVYTHLSPIFAREARFSKRQPVPPFGDVQSDRAAVESFYSFWYAFDSWRSFEYLDKDDAETAENRDHKRHLEKKNKADRARRKTEDTARVRTLVDLALKHDARMKRFKEEDKLAKKMKKQQAARGGSTTPKSVAPSTPEPAAPAAVEPASEQAAAAAAAAADKDRKAAVKRERKAIKHLVTREANYLLPAAATPSADDMTRVSAALDQLLDACKDDAQELENVHGRLAAALAKDSPKSRANVKTAFDAECERTAAAREQDRSAASTSAAPAATLPTSKVVPWSAKELQMLIAGVNAIPGGTVARWEKIAEYVAEHSDNPKVRRTADVIAMAKRVQGRPASAVAGKALQALQAHTKKHNDDVLCADAPTLRDEAYERDGTAPPPPAAASAASAASAATAAAATWSLAQQEQLQKALRAYPPSYKEADRFDKIAGMVEGKSKKECMARIKYLAEQVKLKKMQQQQQQAAQQGSK